MTITCVHYIYGVIVQKRVFNELKDDEKKLFDILDIPHDFDPTDFGLYGMKEDLSEYIIIGKIINTITFGFGKLSDEINEINEKELEEKFKKLNLPIDSIKKNPDTDEEYECEYITIPDSCNCCS